MKTTGVVRRIDELGRIVIPKEIRRTLRIRDGETLEIFVDKEIIGLKKYSPMEDMEDVAKKFVDIIHPILQNNIFVTDRDSIIAYAGEDKKKYLGMGISKDVENLIENRKKILSNSLTEMQLIIDEMESVYMIANPIIVNGDAIGLVVVYSLDNALTAFDEKMSYVVAQFLGKRIEE